MICPDTFQTLSLITLHCPDIFAHPSMQVINKNYPLLTDGSKLYIIGKRFTAQRNEEGDNNAEVKSTLSPEEKKKKREEKAKKKEDKKEEDHTIKILEYMLYEFDLMNPKGGNVDDYLEEEDPASV